MKSKQPQKRIHARFYASESGNEPVKEALIELGRPTKTVVGEDIRFVELNWRVDKRLMLIGYDQDQVDTRKLFTRFGILLRILNTELCFLFTKRK